MCRRNCETHKKHATRNSLVSVIFYKLMKTYLQYVPLNRTHKCWMLWLWSPLKWWYLSCYYHPHNFSVIYSWLLICNLLVQNCRGPAEWLVEGNSSDLMPLWVTTSTVYIWPGSNELGNTKRHTKTLHYSRQSLITWHHHHPRNTVKQWWKSVL